MPKLMLTS